MLYHNVYLMIGRNLKLTYSPAKGHIPQGSSGPISNNNNEKFGEAAQTNCLSLYVWHLLTFCTCSAMEHANFVI